MSDITLSSAVRSNLLNLQGTADLLGRTQERLATGLEVNSALDNPTNFFTAASLNSRAGDLGRLLDGVANATQTLEQADNGIQAITDLVESAQASARQALQARGPQTTNTVAGVTSATFDPQALTTVAGNNDTTGTNAGAIDPEAVADITSGTIAADTADIPDFASADISGNTNSATTLDSGTRVINENDSITLSANGRDFTITFQNDATGAGRDAPTIVGDAITLDTDSTVAETATDLDAFFTAAGVDITVGDAAGTLTFDSGATIESIEFDESVAGSLDRLGLGATGLGAAAADSNRSAAAVVLTQNTALDDLVGSNATLQVELGGTNLGTITFGTGAGQVTDRDSLVTALNDLSGVDATVATNQITIDTSDNSDVDSDIVLTADSNDTLETVLGFTPDATGGTVATAQPDNLITNGDFNQGDTLDITVGSGSTLTVTFGTDDTRNEVSTVAELNQRLQGLSGGAASVDARGELNVTSDNGGDDITLGGDAAALNQLGVAAGTSSNLLGANITDGDSLSIQVGTNTQLDITFGTGDNEVNTFSELETALGNLAGGTATIDDQTGAISVEATNGADDIIIGAAADGPGANSPADVLNSFGLTAGTTNSVTADSTQRAELETQFNETLLQINELAEDAGFNGVNLLDGDNLQVIFNEDGSSALDIDGVTFDAAGLGLSSVAAGGFQSDESINNTLDSLDGAIQTLRGQSSQFGSNLSIVETREDFTNNTINTLETGAANLTLADTNEEGANLTALQTRQQLSTTALSLATQADQNVLRLF